MIQLLINLRARLYEKVFGKKYLTRRQYDCNKDICAWLDRSMVQMDSYISFYDDEGDIDKVDEIENMVMFTKHLIDLSQKNELELIAMKLSKKYKDFIPYCSVQEKWVFETHLRQLYLLYPQCNFHT